MVLAHTAADGESIQARQHPIKDEHLGIVLLDEGKRHLAVEGLYDGVPIPFQALFDEVAEIHLIFDEQYRRHRPNSPHTLQDRRCTHAESISLTRFATRRGTGCPRRACWRR